MPSMIWRLLVSLLMLPVGYYAMTIAGAMLVQPMFAGVGGSNTVPICLFYLAVWAVLVGVFVGIWAKVVVWTHARRAGTWGVLFLSILLGALGGYLYTSIFRSQTFGGAFGSQGVDLLPYGMMIAVPVSFLTFSIGCAIVWRESPAEAVVRVQRTWLGAVCCPVCKYEMTGQKTLECSECGRSYTLGEFVALSAEGRTNAASKKTHGAARRPAETNDAAAASNQNPHAAEAESAGGTTPRSDA